MDDAAEREEGGDPVCWAHLVCPDCGAISSEGHRGRVRQLAEQAVHPARPDDPGSRPGRAGRPAVAALQRSRSSGRRQRARCARVRPRRARPPAAAASGPSRSPRSAAGRSGACAASPRRGSAATAPPRPFPARRAAAGWCGTRPGPRARPAPPPPARFRPRGSSSSSRSATQTEKPSALQVGPRTGGAEAGRRQPAPDDVLLGRVAQPGEPRAGSLRAEQPQVAGDAVDAAGGQHHDALGRQVPAVPRGQGLDRDLVADPLDEHDRPGGGRSRQRRHGRLGRGRRPAHVPGEKLLAVVRPHDTTVNHGPGLRQPI